jgi:hypothetical protein
MSKPGAVLPPNNPRSPRHHTMSAALFRGVTVSTPETPHFRINPSAPMPCSRRVFWKNHFRSFLLVITRHIIPVTPPLELVSTACLATLASNPASKHVHLPLSIDTHLNTNTPALGGLLPRGGLLGKAHKRISPFNCLRFTSLTVSDFFARFRCTSDITILAVSRCRYNLTGREPQIVSHVAIDAFMIDASISLKRTALACFETLSKKIKAVPVLLTGCFKSVQITWIDRWIWVLYSQHFSCVSLIIVLILSLHILHKHPDHQPCVFRKGV